MTKLFGAAVILLTMAACNNNSEGSASGSSPDSPTTQYRGVENVNGNIPDTIATGAEPGANFHSDSAH
jgi:hypothetical protein